MFRGFNNWIYPLLYRRFGYLSKTPEYGARALGGTCIDHGHIQHLRMQDEQLSEGILGASDQEAAMPMHFTYIDNIMFIVSILS